MLDLSIKSHRDQLEEMIERDVDEFCKNYYENGHRNHLGASEMGEQCHRKLWYKFRWVKKPDFDGRMLRLFNVGHMAEPRFITYLRGIGFQVKEFAEDGKQFRISGAKGHYGGSLDGQCIAPERYGLESNLVLLNEFKTNNTGAGYAKVDEEGVAKAKPKHYAQMCQYGFKYNLKYGLYMIENKNDSDITFKIVELDLNYGASLEKKAEEIIFSQEAPPRIAENPAFAECKFCDFKEICHNNALPEINCRSCRQSIPVDNAKWKCSRFNDIIPEDFILSACKDYNAI